MCLAQARERVRTLTAGQELQERAVSAASCLSGVPRRALRFRGAGRTEAVAGTLGQLVPCKTLGSLSQPRGSVYSLSSALASLGPPRGGEALPVRVVCTELLHGEALGSAWGFSATWELLTLT